MVVSASAAECPCGSARKLGQSLFASASDLCVSPQCRASCNSAKQRNQFFSLGSRITFLRFFIGDTSTCPGSGSASTWSKASLASPGGASGGDKPSPRFHHAGSPRPTSSGNSSPAIIEAYSTSCQRFLAEGLPAPFAGFGHRPIATALACAAPARARRSSRSRFASAPDTAHTVKGCCIDKNLFNSSYLEGKELSVHVSIATSHHENVIIRAHIQAVHKRFHRQVTPCETARCTSRHESPETCASIVHHLSGSETDAQVEDA